MESVTEGLSDNVVVVLAVRVLLVDADPVAVLDTVKVVVGVSDNDGVED